jgi:hypothetical protein
MIASADSTPRESDTATINAEFFIGGWLVVRGLDIGVLLERGFARSNNSGLLPAVNLIG